MKTVNIQFYKNGQVWRNAVGNMARRVVDNAPDDLNVFFGKNESEGDLVYYFDIGPAKQGQRPGIMGVHQLSPRQAGRRLEDLALALKRHRCAVVLTPEMAAQVAPHQANVSVIPAGVDDVFRIIGEDTVKDHRDRPTLGVCGLNRAGNNDVKGAELLTRIMHRLPTFRYNIAGSGWDAAVREAERMGVSVSCQTYQSSEMPTFYRGLDIFLCTSREEGGPQPILQALASGVPVVSTSVGYANMLRDANNPYVTVVPFVGSPEKTDYLGDSASFQDSIGAELVRQAAMTDEERLQYRNLISDSVSGYTWNAYCAAHYELYRQEAV